MSQTITVNGSMYEFNYIELSSEDLQRLLEARDSDGDMWEKLEDIHEKLMDDSIINGFTFSIGDPKPQLIVGSDEIYVECERTDSEKPELLEKFKAHYLVFEQWSKHGSMELEIDDEFEPMEFYFSIDSAKLPSGEVRKILDACYSDGDFEFQGSQPSYSNLYILKSDGSRIDL
jgi:hypothetical protein